MTAYLNPVYQEMSKVLIIDKCVLPDLGVASFYKFSSFVLLQACLY